MMIAGAVIAAGAPVFLGAVITIGSGIILSGAAEGLKYMIWDLKRK